ncbi:MAG: divergent polysaccharide deacetylase family protein [Bradymonadia bacterium]
MGNTLNRTISLVVAAAIGAAFVYFLIPNRSTPQSTTQSTVTNLPQNEVIPPIRPVKRDPHLDQMMLDMFEQCGVDSARISTGIYRLTGSQWEENPLRPLLEIQLPSVQPAATFWQRLSDLLAKKGYQLAPPKSSSGTHRPDFRAVAKNGAPELIIRALPSGPSVTIVVDGIGHEPALIEALIDLDTDVTFSVDSDSAFAKTVSTALTDAKRELITSVALSKPLEEPSANTKNQVAGLLAQSIVSTPGTSGLDLNLVDDDAWSPSMLNELLSRIGTKGLFILNRNLVSSDRMGEASHRFGLRMGKPSHVIRGKDTELATHFRRLDSALAYAGHVNLLIQATPKTLSFLDQWLATLRQRDVSILRLSEVVR